MTRTAKKLRKTRLKPALIVRGGAMATLSLLMAGLFQIPAFAQNDINAENPDTPIAARPALKQAPELPVEVQPEQLDVHDIHVSDPNKAKRRRANNRNAWPSTALPQSMGMNSSRINTIQSKNSAAKKIGNTLQVELPPTDMLFGTNGEKLAALEPVFAAPSLDDGLVDFDPSLRGVLFDAPGGIKVDQSVFKLDLGGQFCLGTAAECSANVTDEIKLGYAKNITHGKRGGFNLQITPRAGFRLDDDSQSALVGAVVRIGDDLRLGSNMKSNTWYVFAGANAEAKTFASDSAQRLTSGQFYLQDRIIIGDAQAGLGYKIGGADLALTYFKRQAKTENLSYDEDAAAFSITWTR